MVVVDDEVQRMVDKSLAGIVAVVVDGMVAVVDGGMNAVAVMVVAEIEIDGDRRVHSLASFRKVRRRAASQTTRPPLTPQILLPLPGVAASSESWAGNRVA